MGRSSDISKEFRASLKEAIDLHPNTAVKQAGYRHLKAWDEWAKIGETLQTYGPLKMILFLPMFLYWNSKWGQAYTKLNQTQEDFNNICAQSGMQPHQGYSLKTIERPNKEPISSIGVPQ